MTRPDDIPEDVWEAARAVAEEIGCPWHDDTNVIARALAAAEQRGREGERLFVEQAFRDGIAYASNVEVTDVDEAWRSSKAHAASIRRGDGTAPPSSPPEQNGESATPSHAPEGRG